jgi:hypothetical protein
MYYIPKGKTKKNGGNDNVENHLDCKSINSRGAGQTGLEGNKGI